MPGKSGQPQAPLVLPSSDPFDEGNFDAIALLNAYFPTEMSLSGAESTCERLATKMQRLDASILQAVEQQSSTGSAAKQDLEDAGAHVVTLDTNLRRIREKSVATEDMLLDICADIQTLDNAKTNLTSTITALRRLDMLENAVEQLSELTEERAYKEASNLLEAMSQLAPNFEAYKAVPKVCELLSSVRALRSQLQAQVLEEFKLHISPDMSEEVAAMLADAAQVVTVLGRSLILKLAQWFCERELGEYEEMFDPVRQDAARPATLEGAEKRFAWLRRWLRNYASLYAGIMPEEWQVPKLVCEEFCQRTRRHLGVVLSKSSKDLDVRLLLHVMQRTQELETELNTKAKSC
ncbi:Vps53-like protein [Baffinella frigidus]|nr:Vps53-like protein [Cryptophyta sp. CCMP2293]